MGAENLNNALSAAEFCNGDMLRKFWRADDDDSQFCVC